MNEAETRAELIDPALAAAGWGSVEGSRVRREYLISPGRIEGRGRRGSPVKADYLLEYRNTKLAVIESKAAREALTEGVGQAKDYAGKLSVRFTYATNGHGIYGIDMETGKEGEIAAYPTPEQLWEMTFPSTGSGTRDAADKASELAELWRDRFAAIPYEDKGGSHPGRYYQETAIERVLAAVGDGRNRILLTLATGTGKTFIAFQIAWKLFQARWNLSSEPTRRPRILFLADRNILANQAYNAFSAFPEDALVRIRPDQIRRTGRPPTNGSLFFTIFQTFMASAGSATNGATGSATNGATGSATETTFRTITDIREGYAYSYLLECADGSFYTGSTKNLKERLQQHQRGEGAAHTKRNLPVSLVYYETHDHIGEAFEREKQIQGWSRAKKIALIKGDVTKLQKLSNTNSDSAKVTDPVIDSLTVTEPAEVFGEYPPDFFDLIIIDECHRGGANDEGNWRGILEYFSPAVQLGLTATPKRSENTDTYAYFGDPVFVYSLKEGINDGFLTPFRVKQIQTTLDTYYLAPDDTVVEGEVESGRLYEEPDFNRNIEICEREKKRVEIFMDLIDQREKTLVFCANQHHALLVRDLINQVKKSKEPNYCQRVTADDGELGEQHLRDFQDNEKSIPTILTTSQKLSTGVDARNIRNIVLMRPVNSMIEFKQIIGRGTRLYDGKDYFTIYDFVKAHQHFLDPEWDGEPEPPEVPEPAGSCTVCGNDPCTCPKTPCGAYGQRPCICPKEPCPKCGERPCVCRRKAKVKLADGKERSIQHMTCTSFWHPDGTPMSAVQFMEQLFGKLPEFFHDEEELRRIWSAPDTRRKLLHGLAEKGFGFEQLAEMQKIIDAQASDLFDVLAHVAYAKSPLSREVRASHARIYINTNFPEKQQAFLDFVLQHYVEVGVEELDQEKLTPLLRLKYHNSIADAVADLGQPEEIGAAFSGFQKALYE